MLDKTNDKNLIVLGNHVQALGICRQAGSLGFNIILFNRSSISISRFSKYCTSFKKFIDRKDLLKQLENKMYFGSFIVATNDELVHFLVDNYSILKMNYHIPFEDPDVIKNCLNKRYTYALARNAGINIPESNFPDNIDELNSVADSVTFPVILKPAIMHTFHAMTGKKALLCNNKQELVNNYHSFIKNNPPDEVIIQEFIPSGPKELFSLGAFCHKGRIISGFMANRQRQNPMTFGNSTCYARTVYKEEILQASKKILFEMNYSGFCEVEFMFDNVSQEYKLLEINARPWKWHSLANKAGLNFIDNWVHIVEKREIKATISRKENMIWVENITDIYISFMEILKGRLSLAEYIKSLSYEKEFAVYSIHDPLPSIMYILFLPYLFFKR